jgi:hypothetical protein
VLGGNDYNAQIFGGYSPEMDKASGQSPTIVDAIGKSVDQLTDQPRRKVRRGPRRAASRST